MSIEFIIEWATFEMSLYVICCAMELNAARFIVRMQANRDIDTDTVRVNKMRQKRNIYKRSK